MVFVIVKLEMHFSANIAWSHNRCVAWIDGCGQLKSHLAKIGGHCSSKGGDKAFFYISRDHMINESRDSVSEIPSP